MVFKYAGAGIGNAASYLAAGLPYITGSAITGSEEFRAAFPFVTKRVQVQVYDGTANDHIRVHFNSVDDGNVNGGQHWWHVKDGDPFEAEVRCSELYITHDKGASVTFHVLAEMTTIPAEDMYVLSGSGLTT